MSPSILQIGPNLAISLQKICEIIDKARKFDVRNPELDFDNVPDASGGTVLSMLEHHENDPGYDELLAFIVALSTDEQIDLIALTWLGRGDATIDDWEELLDDVREARDSHTIDTLLGTPLLAEYLEGALAEFGLSCEEFELGRM